MYDDYLTDDRFLPRKNARIKLQHWFWHLLSETSRSHSLLNPCYNKW
jgi:hypothetical protein